MSDFVPVKSNMICADVVNNPRVCAGLIFWNKLNLVKLAIEYANDGVDNNPLINGAYINFILSQAVEQK